MGGLGRRTRESEQEDEGGDSSGFFCCLVVKLVCVVGFWEYFWEAFGFWWGFLNVKDHGTSSLGTLERDGWMGSFCSMCDELRPHSERMLWFVYAAGKRGGGERGV